MKSSVVIFTILAVYFLVLCSVYTVWNFMVHGRLEWAGSVTLLLSAIFSAMISGYLWLTARKQGGTLVEDKLDADIDDGDAEIGEFSPWSWWPFLLAFAIAMVVLGMCIGFNFWLSFLSMPLVLVSMVGWVYEYYRGNFAR